MNKVLCFIEARMGSGRLPGKVLKRINKNFTVIDYVIKNILNSKYFNKNDVYLLTSIKKENDKELLYFPKDGYWTSITHGKIGEWLSSMLIRDIGKF